MLEARRARRSGSSTDGLDWESVGVTFTDPGPRVQPIWPPAGGYVAIGDDTALYVSTTGARWAAVDGLDDLHKTMAESDGMSNSWMTPNQVFVVEVTLTGQRRLWVMRVAPYS